MLHLFLMLGEVVVFYILYAQMPTSLNFFAIHNVHHTLLGFDIKPGEFQALNPFWIIIASPI